MSRPIMRKPLLTNRRPVPGPSSSSTLVRRPLPVGGGGGGGGRVGTNAKGTEEGYLYVAGVRDNSKRVTEYRVS